MYTSIISKTIMLMLVISTISFNSQAENSKMSIEKLIQTYQQALNASNTDAVMKLYSNEPVFMPQHSVAQNGKEAVKQAYDFVFKTIKLNVEFSIYEIEEFGDTAWARTSSKGKTTILENGAVIDEGNNELFVFKKVNGEWKIHRYLFATTTPRL